MSILDWFRARPTLSPGPSGGWFDGDYRVPTTYLTTPRALTPGNYTRTIGKRYYEIHVPTGYKHGGLLRAVFVLHGGGYASVARYQSQMDAVADREGFLVVYPAGTGSVGWDRALWWNDEANADGTDDVSYIASVLGDAQQFVRIDAKRVYACGMSNGAEMTFLLAARLRDRFAAFGAVAAARAVKQLNPRPTIPTPLIQFHGTADELAPYFPIPYVIDSWVVLNGGDGQPESEVHNGDAHGEFYPCDVIHWRLDGGGHTWPGGQRTKLEGLLRVGEVNRDINASELMWEFFKRFSLA